MTGDFCPFDKKSISLYHWWTDSGYSIRLTNKPLSLAIILLQRITVVSNHFHSVKNFLFSSAKPRDFDGILGTRLPVSMYTTKTPIDNCRFNVTQLKEFFTFSDRYQLNYLICIKDFNAQTITSLKLNLLYFFIYYCQHHERKTICLDIFLLSDRQYRTLVFTQPLFWRLHIIYRIYDYDMLTLSQ